MVPTVATIPLPGETLRLSDRNACGPLPRIALRSFFAGPENALVGVAVRSVLEPDARRYTPLVLIGPSAVGKSHVARGLARRWAKAGQRGQMVCTTAAEFAQEYGREYAARCLPKFQARYRSATLLIVEDLPALAGRESASLELLTAIDAVQQSGGMVIVTSRQHPTTIDHLLPALASRLMAGLVVPISLPDAAARLAILQELSVARGIALPSDAAQALAAGMSVSVPELVTALLELSASFPVVDAEVVANFLRQRSLRNRPSLTVIAALVAKENQLSVKQLKSANRSRAIVSARNHAIYLARILTSASLEAIGEFFGKRDHTTILHSFRRMEELIQTDATTKTIIEQLRQRLERP